MNNISQLSPEEYTETYRVHLFEQYKLYVEMADRISARRMLANTFYLGISTALVTIFTAIASYFDIQKTWIIFPLVFVLLFCYIWWRTIVSYGQLNAGKYKVIIEIEALLPIQMYEKEWNILEKGKNPRVYKPLTKIEDKIPIIFGILCIILTGIYLLV